MYYLNKSIPHIKSANKNYPKTMCQVTPKTVMNVDEMTVLGLS